MPRIKSWNQIVADGRKACIEAAREVHESPRSFNTALGGRCYQHLNCCAALTRVDAPYVASLHFDKLFENEHAYYFGDITSPSYATNRRRAEQRTYALLLAGVSLE